MAHDLSGLASEVGGFGPQVAGSVVQSRVETQKVGT